LRTALPSSPASVNNNSRQWKSSGNLCGLNGSEHALLNLVFDFYKGILILSA
jgi:hypothetical protein